MERRSDSFSVRRGFFGPAGLLVALLLGAGGTARAAAPECRPVPPGPCECTDGPCCDGCRFLGPGFLCAQGIEEIACAPVAPEAPETGACGGEVRRRTAARFCSGASAGCDGAVGGFGLWESLGRCDGGSVCVPKRPFCRPSPSCGCLARCDDGDPCTVDTCPEPGKCGHTPLDCDDGDVCTPDWCDGGVCLHGAPDCDDGTATSARTIAAIG